MAKILLGRRSVGLASLLVVLLSPVEAVTSKCRVPDSF